MSAPNQQPQQEIPQTPMQQRAPQGSVPTGNGVPPAGAPVRPMTNMPYPGAAAPMQNQYPYLYSQYPPAVAAKKPINGFAIAGLVVSLIATVILLGQFSKFISPFGVVGLILSIIGYLVNRDEDQTGGSRTARIFAIVGAILSIIAIVVTLCIGVFNPAFASSTWF